MKACIIIWFVVHIITTVHLFEIFMGHRVVAIINIKPVFFLLGGLGSWGLGGFGIV